MAVAASSADSAATSGHSVLLGVLALLVDARECRIEGDRDAVKTEVILSRIGMSNEDIATVMGKNKDAVRMAISRAGKAA